MFFRAVGEDGRVFPRDGEFFDRELVRGIDHVLTSVCGLDDGEMRRTILSYHDGISRGTFDLERAARGGL